ncbi:MAG TPA: hypothetical protein DEG69_10480 [Flavobacteriaceae bacterium]|nr:hypothetical protein [Flavobacteriaceae bacterium]
MYFQTIDDKKECIGVYKDGHLYFDEMPPDMLRTWRYSGTLEGSAVEYAWLYASGADVDSILPDEIKEEQKATNRKMMAYKKSFDLAKVSLHEHCFFDLVPHDFLKRFLECRNKITEYVFENFERPDNYEHMEDVCQLIHKIKYQTLNVNAEGCRSLFMQSSVRADAKKFLNRKNYIDYNLFGTRTGRLTTNEGSFPILTVKKELRKLIKPKNDWYLSLDYNGAEIRTLLALSGQEQPQDDIHTWNIINVLKRADIPREEAKTIFFSWLYNPDSKIINTHHYDREKVLDKWYDGAYISTPFDRKIKIDKRRALNYLIQSTTSDVVLERACRIDKFLKGKKSFISHIVHDEIVIDLCNEEREIIVKIKEIFADTRLGKYMVNLSAGLNYLEMNELTL